MENKEFKKFVRDRIEMFNGVTKDEDVTIKRSKLIDSIQYAYRSCLEKFESIEENRVKNSWLKIYDKESKRYHIEFGTESYIAYRACEMYCFADCCDYIEAKEIYLNGRKVYYTGWQPDMIMELADSRTHKIVYSNQFPNWDH